jgi:hypothetical protein
VAIRVSRTPLHRNSLVLRKPSQHVPKIIRADGDSHQVLLLNPGAPAEGRGKNLVTFPLAPRIRDSLSSRILPWTENGAGPRVPAGFRRRLCCLIHGLGAPGGQLSSALRRKAACGTFLQSSIGGSLQFPGVERAAVFDSRCSACRLAVLRLLPCSRLPAFFRMPFRQRSLDPIVCNGLPGRRVNQGLCGLQRVEQEAESCCIPNPAARPGLFWLCSRR